MKKRFCKQLVFFLLLLALPIGCTACRHTEYSEKPVIYLYPEEETTVTVRLDYHGELLYSYPTYNDGWQVIAKPDGTLTDTRDGREYTYLFWEGTDSADYDFSRGFVVRGEETDVFLQQALEKLGLLPHEYNEFIVYWGPRMRQNPYNLITFQTDAYTENAKLSITPEPDSLLRVFMAYKALETPVELDEPDLPAFTREGFTVVEWGGAEIK